MSPQRITAVCHSRATQRGVALFVALLLIFILTLLLVEGMATASSESQLAANQQYLQRAFEAAQGGLATGLQRLARGADGLPARFTLAREGSVTDGSDTQLLLAAVDRLPSGYSAGRFVAQHFEIRSRGHSARAARSDLVQGAVRIVPVTDAAAHRPP